MKIRSWQLPWVVRRRGPDGKPLVLVASSKLDGADLVDGVRTPHMDDAAVFSGLRGMLAAKSLARRNRRRGGIDVAAVTLFEATSERDAAEGAKKGPGSNSLSSNALSGFPADQRGGPNSGPPSRSSATGGRFRCPIADREGGRTAFGVD